MRWHWRGIAALPELRRHDQGTRHARLTVHLRAVAALCLFAVAAAPSAAVNTDKPLSEREGWVAVVVDNSAQITSLHRDGPGWLGDDLVKGPGPGRSVRVVRAQAGTYR
ncbi:MAG: hypothetical protein AMXMBFR59_31040 [Rhodanobacteraceae bacterium]